MKNKIICLLSVVVLITGFTAAYYCFAVNSSRKFADVQSDAWYAESVEYVFDNGLMNGVTETSFEPETHITRGMIVTIIYRMENSPKVNGTLKFSDVNETYYYAQPVIWASGNKIVNGYDADTFAPEDKITREQFAAILCRYAKYKGIDVSADENIGGKLSAYSDSDKISDYAKDSMLWANSNKLITGVTSSTLVPQGIASRAQAATIFMRFDKLLGQFKDNNTSTEVKENKDNKENKEQNEIENVKEPEQEKTQDKNNPSSGNGSGSDKVPADRDENAGEWDDVKGETNDEENESEITKPAIFVADAVADGKYADVIISVANNPGIASLKFDVEFDDESLKLVSVDFDSRWGDYITAPTPYKNPQTVNLISPFENITAEGKLATLRFEILGTSFNGDITIKCDKNNIFNSDFDEVEFDVKNGKIKNK